MSPRLRSPAKAFGFVSPDEPGWVVERSDKSQTIFEKPEAGAKDAAAVHILEIPAADSQPREFMRYAEGWKKKELSAYNVASIHFNDLHYRGMACVGYDGIFKENAPPLRRDRIVLFGCLCVTQQ